MGPGDGRRGWQVLGGHAGSGGAVRGRRGEVAVGIKGVGLILEVVSMCVVMRAVMVVLMGRG